MSFLLATAFADPNSPSFFMTDYEEGLYISTANFAFHRNHIQLFRYIRFSRQIVKPNYDICL